MKTLTFISAWVCSMLLSANASAQSVTYNFVVADEGTIQLPIWGAEVTSGGVALNLLAAGSETFDNRFAVGPTNRNNESGNSSASLLQPITLTHFRLPCTFCMTRTEVLPDLFSFFSTNMPQR